MRRRQDPQKSPADRLKSLAGFILLLLTLTALPPAGPGARAAAQEVDLQPFRPQEQISPDPATARVVSNFARAWSGRNAAGVAELIPADGRASVTIESRGVSGQMSRGQIEALLAGLFAEANRPAFQISTVHHSDEASAYAVGEWSYEVRRAPSRRTETVFAGFRQPLPGNWILSELRIEPAR